MEYIIKPAQFNYVNPAAKMVIVGITPGNNQLKNSRIGVSDKEIKRINAFAGNMRPKLAEMLDSIGINNWLKVESCSCLWDNPYFDLVDMTSLLKDAVYIKMKNGAEEMFKDVSRISKDTILQDLFMNGFVRNCSLYANARLFVACGKDVFNILNSLRVDGIIKGEIIAIPHPSGANSGRIAAFLGKKTDFPPKDDSYKWYASQSAISKEIVKSLMK